MLSHCVRNSHMRVLHLAGMGRRKGTYLHGKANAAGWVHRLALLTGRETACTGSVGL